eukprot:m.369281 g.369281  ORF g.369281 m.369281 type:complete len:60 (-) comp48794_c0_seq1:27-206(-)
MQRIVASIHIHAQQKLWFTASPRQCCDTSTVVACRGAQCNKVSQTAHTCVARAWDPGLG